MAEWLKGKWIVKSCPESISSAQMGYLWWPDGLSSRRAYSQRSSSSCLSRSGRNICNTARSSSSHSRNTAPQSLQCGIKLMTVPELESKKTTAGDNRKKGASFPAPF